MTMPAGTSYCGLVKRMLACIADGIQQGIKNKHGTHTPDLGSKNSLVDIVNA